MAFYSKHSMILTDMFVSLLALLVVHKIQVESTNLGYKPNPAVQWLFLAEVGENIAEYQGYHMLTRVISVLKMRLEVAEKQLLELKDLNEKAMAHENEQKDIKEMAMRHANELKDVKEEAVRQEKELKDVREEAVRQEKELKDVKEAAVRQEKELKDVREEAVRQEKELKDVKEAAVRQEKELKNVREEVVRQEKELKGVTERLNNADIRIAELEEFVKRYVGDYHNVSEQFSDEEMRKVNNNLGASGLYVPSNGPHHKKNGQHYKHQKKQKGNFRKLKREIGVRKVAFTVGMSKHPVYLNVGQIVPFDTILYNEGNIYNSDSHILTCPVSGTYVFTLTAVAPYRHLNTYLTLVVNGNAKLNVAAATDVSRNQGSSTLVTRCEAGQNVWANVSDGNALNGNLYTSFSGFLLWTDSAGSS